MNNATLWWIDPDKVYRVYSLGDPLPPDIQTKGSLYLSVEDTEIIGQYNLYNITGRIDLNLSALDSTASLGQSRTYRVSDIEKANTYDALRRTQWTVGHLNITNNKKDDKYYQSVDPDLYISQKEITDLSNILCFVNGAYHQHVLSPQGDILIYDGCQTLRNESSHDDVTVVDFTPVGGIKKFKITKEMFQLTSALPNGIRIDISQSKDYNNETFKDYYALLIVDGTLYTKRSVARSLSDTVIDVEVGRLSLLRNLLRSPILRKENLPIPLPSNLREKSDGHDSTLDTFIDSQTVPESTLVSNDWILSRLQAPHSALILVPKTVVFKETGIQIETDEKWYQVLPTKKTVIDCLLNIDGRRYSPLYIHTRGYRDRTLMPIPYNEDRYLSSLDDPLSTVVVSPFREYSVDSIRKKYITLSQWLNLNVIGEFS